MSLMEGMDTAKLYNAPAPLHTLYDNPSFLHAHRSPSLMRRRQASFHDAQQMRILQRGVHTLLVIQLLVHWTNVISLWARRSRLLLEMALTCILALMGAFFNSDIDLVPRR